MITMFKVGHYYRATHKDDGCRNPRICIIKVLERVTLFDGKETYDVLIIRSNPQYSRGNNINLYLYEDWCTDIEELDEIEALTIVL